MKISSEYDYLMWGSVRINENKKKHMDRIIKVSR
jgi:hypothetical protein